MNNNDIAKITLVKRERERKREREGERAIATNTTNINKDIFDIQNNIVVDHFKMMLRKIIVTNFTVKFNARTKNVSNNGATQQQQEKLSRPPRKSAFIVEDGMIKK